MKEDMDYIRRVLKEAFANVPCPEEYVKEDACGSMSHEECVRLRKDFYNLTPAQIQYDLPYLLEDVINSQTEDDNETEDVEFLILQLDPFSVDDPVIRKNKLEQFANFNPKQAQAICQWLKLMHTWDGLRPYYDWVDAAIGYWCRHTEFVDEPQLYLRGG